MPVLRGFSIHIDRAEVLRRQTKGEPTPALLATADWAMQRALALVEPALAYSILRSEGVQGEELVLEGGRRLRLGPHADLAAPATQVIAYVATIGPRLEEEVRALMAGPDLLKGYMLDCAGVVAVGQTAMHLRELAEEMAREKRWGVSPSLYPGSPMGWPLRGQRDLVALVPAEEIGVTLNPSCMLIPQKSCSGLIGMGPGYQDTQVGSLCHWCSLAESCWRRKARAPHSMAGETVQASH